MEVETPTLRSALKIYLSAFCFFLFAAAIDRATQDIGWRYDLAVSMFDTGPRTVSFWLLVALVVLATITVTLATTIYLNDRVPRLMNVLLTAGFGGTCMLTLITTPFVALGMTIGAIVSAFVTWLTVETRRRLSLAFFFWFLPTCLLGFASGAAIYLSYIHFGQVSPVREITVPSAMLLLFGLGSIVAIRCVDRYRLKNERSVGWLQAMMLSVTFLALVAIGIATSFLHGRPRASENWRWWDIRFSDFNFDAGVELSQGSNDSDAISASRVPFVRKLFIDEGSQITDRGFSRLYLRYLEELNFTLEAGMTSASLRRLPYHQLTRLIWNGTGFADDAIGKSPVHLPRLTTLSLQDTRITSDGFQWLRFPPRLEYVDLSGSAIDDDVFRVLEDIDIRMLTLRGTNVTGEGFKLISGRISHLDLTDTRPNPQYFTDLVWDLDNQGAGRQLQSLIINNVPMSPEGIDAVCNLRGLTQLSVAGCGLKSKELAALSRLPRLWQLRLDANVATVELVKSLPSLAYLTLYHEDGEDEGDELRALVDRLEAAKNGLGVTCRPAPARD